MPVLAQPLAENPPNTASVQPRVVRAFERQERVRVFLILREQAAQAPVLAAAGAQLELWHRYRSIPALAGELSRTGLAHLRKHPAVAAIQLDGEGSGGLADALPATGADEVHAVRGLTGKGITAAVLDSGASTEHPALRGAIVAQHCFTPLACPPNGTREGESAEDDHNHGSNVTGIVASRGGGKVAKGYAPGVNVVSVKVLNANNAGRISDWVAGFDWIYENLESLDVKIINASLVSTAEYGSAAECDANEMALARVTQNLVDAGVVITSSSGNTGHTMTMTAPACNTGVIAVGASYDSNLGVQPESGGTYQALGGGSWPECADRTTSAKTMACFTSTAGSRLDLLAPGTQLASAGRGSTSAMFRGTSQAAPGVAGIAALLLECNPSLGPSALLDVLKKTGEPVLDPRTGLFYPLVRAVHAVDEACPLGAPAPQPPSANAGSRAAAAPANTAGDLFVPQETDIAARSVAAGGGGLETTAGSLAPALPATQPKASGCAVVARPNGDGPGLLAALALAVVALRRRRRVSLAAAALLALGCACSRGAELTPAEPPIREDACRASEVEHVLESEASVPVIILLTEAGKGTARERQDRLVSALGDEFAIARRYASIPGIAGTITRAGLERAQKHPEVRCVQLDGAGSGS